MSGTIFVPFPKELYDDLIRFSDGRVNPAEWAVERLEAWIESNFSSEMNGLGWANDSFMANFEPRIEEFAEKYYPSVLAYWAEKDDENLDAYRAKRKPLVWKEVSIAASSEVRMAYGGTSHYAIIHNGKIKDDDGEFSPSEWARKVAGDTSRNAWRDLWFKAPGASNWVPAMLIRQQARDSLESELDELIKTSYENREIVS